MDTIYKDYGDTLQMFGISSGNLHLGEHVLSHIASGTTTWRAFHERQPNSGADRRRVNTPRQGRVPVFARRGEGRSAVMQRTRICSRTASSGMAPGLPVAQHELHNDRFGGSVNTSRGGVQDDTDPGAHSKDQASRITGNTGSAVTRIVGDNAWLEYKESGQTAGATKFEKLPRKPTGTSLDARWTDTWRTRVPYVKPAQVRAL